MGRDLIEVFVRSGRYALLCPLLFLVPVAIEMVQHAVEIRAGMYVDIAGLKAAEGDVLRLTIGHVKVIALFLTGYWAARFLVFGDDPVAARRIDPVAVRLFVPVMVWSLFWLILVQDVPLVADAAGISGNVAAWVLMLSLIVSLLFEPLLSAWKTAAAAGNPGIGFVRSIRLTRGVYLYAVVVSLLAMLPLMVAHYALAFLAVGKAPAVVWAVMALDSLLVGYLGVVMVAAAFVVARRATVRGGVGLGAAAPIATRGAAA
ncbi:MAG: hypothetical protein EOP59_02420 [Sphingomonadales bacterium]|nr:MAG: hypothetical protein EOP59_02420 [Sphingomonadales bacterium]